MERYKNLSARLFSVFTLTMVGLLGVIQPARAQGIIYGDTVPDGTTIPSDVILYGDNVVIYGNVDGDMLAIGRNVTIDGEVSGSLVLGGEDVTINGPVGGTVYVGAANLVLGEEANLHRNLYFRRLKPDNPRRIHTGTRSIGCQPGSDAGGRGEWQHQSRHRSLRVLPHFHGQLWRFDIAASIKPDEI